PTQPAPTTPPTQPAPTTPPATSNTSLFQMTEKAGTVATFQWTALSGATSYVVQASSNGGASWSTVYTGNQLTYTHPRLAYANTMYSFKVTATTPSGQVQVGDTVTFNSSVADFKADFGS
ncbi:MAG: hypothetical protein ACRC2T_13945, partial [Thermoguttaceae bacterium]